ncbi:hypothetical protein [Geotalea uraniireducens]|uniref:hypothetical protein n=1 Tax=Geotalea uraniireducens TaxID=351604 RepID=UPI0024928336|nr:hypothetical protein [Geotalea uraniireducens]
MPEISPGRRKIETIRDRFLIYRPGGEEIPHEKYLEIHAELLTHHEWIIDGFGCVASAWERFSAAGTLIYIDLSLVTHCRWVTKRLHKGLFVNPEGWPEKNHILKGTFNSYCVLWLCHRKLTPKYRQLVANSTASKRVFHLTSPNDIKTFIHNISQVN